MDTPHCESPAQLAFPHQVLDLSVPRLATHRMGLPTTRLDAAVEPRLLVKGTAHSGHNQSRYMWLHRISCQVQKARSGIVPQSSCIALEMDRMLICSGSSRTPTLTIPKMHGETKFKKMRLSELSDMALITNPTHESKRKGEPFQPVYAVCHWAELAVDELYFRH